MYYYCIFHEQTGYLAYKIYGRVRREGLNELEYYLREDAVKNTDRCYDALTTVGVILKNAPDGFDSARITQKEGYCKAHNILQNALFGKHGYTPEEVRDNTMGNIADSRAFQTTRRFIQDIMHQPKFTKRSCAELCQDITNYYACRHIRDELVNDLTSYYDTNADVSLNGTQIIIGPSCHFPDYIYKIECNQRDDMQYHLKLYHKDQSTGQWDHVPLPDKQAMDSFAMEHNKIARALEHVQDICRHGLKDCKTETSTTSKTDLTRKEPNIWQS